MNAQAIRGTARKGGASLVQTAFPLLSDGDEIEIAVARANEDGAIFQLVAGANEGTILFRPRQSFRDACKAKRVYVARLRRKDLPVAAAMFVPEGHGELVEEEIASVFVHPLARGYKIASWLVSAAMVHRIAGERYDADFQRRWFAKVLFGNNGPHRALIDAGFRREDNPLEFDPRDFGGAIDHMVMPGETIVRAYKYNYDLEALDSVILRLLSFIRDRKAQESRGGSTVTFRFDERILPVEALEAHLNYLSATGRLRVTSEVA